MYKINKKGMQRFLVYIFLINVIGMQSILAKDSDRFITVTSQSNLCQMYFPSNWGAIYKPETRFSELFMTNGTDYCCLEVCSKREHDVTDIQELLEGLFEQETVSSKANLYVDQKKNAWQKINIGKSKAMLFGYKGVYQLALADQPQHIKQKNFKKLIRVIEGKEHYYILIAGMGLDPNQKKAQFNLKTLQDILASFTLLKDPTADNWVDAVIDKHWQKYSYAQQETVQSSGYPPQAEQTLVLFYQGQSEKLIDSPLKNYRVVYNAYTDQIYLNTDKVSTNQADILQWALRMGLSRKDTHRTQGMKEIQKRHLAYDSGERVAKLWNRFNTTNNPPSDASIGASWPVKIQRDVLHNNILVGQFQPNIVKAWGDPIVFELETQKFANR